MARQKTIVLAFSLLLLAGSLAAGPLQAQRNARTRGNAEVTGGRFVETSNGLPIGVPETVGGVYGDQLQRYDSPEPWRHGYFQEIPAYGGFAAFRPYNYKHVLAQSQAAGGWGMSPTMPYSQQFWHRYRERAGMRKRISTRMNDPRFLETTNIVPTGSERRFAVRQYAAPSRQTPRQYSHAGGNDIRSRTPQLTFPARR